ncbi:MAG: hypothetical protein VKI82_09475 [Leptolyngbya sp.]|nr:hypothetical protein [Leptolyngbya sp.]
MKPLKGLPINLAAIKPDPAMFKGLPAILGQPQWVAVMLSVGFHGALFAVGPSFANLQSMAMGTQGSTEAERRVPIIELTAAEQNRLPDFESPAYDFLPGASLPEDFATGEDFASLFPPAGPRSNPLSPLPSGLSALPRIPTSPLGTPLAISPFPSRLGRNAPIVIPNPPTNRLNLPIPRDPETNPEGANASAMAPNQSTEDRPQDARAEDLRPRDEETADGPENSTALNPRLEESESSSSSQAARDLMARVEYSPDLTTADEADRALTAWQSNVTDRLGEPPALAEETFSLEVPYDLRICLRPEPGDGVLGFVLLPGDEAGTVNIATTVLKSTGYPFLNQAATQSLLDRAANSETPLALGTLYRAVVKVLYSDDNCIATDDLLKRAEDEAPAGASTPSSTTPSRPESAPEE